MTKQNAQSQTPPAVLNDDSITTTENMISSPAVPSVPPVPSVPQTNSGSAQTKKSDMVERYTKSLEGVRVLVLRTERPEPVVGTFNWRERIGKFEKGKIVTIPRGVCETLQMAKAVVPIEDGAMALDF